MSIKTISHKWTLPIILTGVFMTTLDFFIVNVAIPSIQRDMHATSAAIQFFIAGFGLAYAAGLITGGRLGDHFGRRKMFMIGMSLFTIASAICGFAPSAAWLIVGRILQGISAAAMSPQVLAIIGTTYEGESKMKAFNAYGLTMGMAAVLGQLIGGLLIQLNLFGLDWRTCFLINIPIGIAALILTPKFVPESSAPKRGRLDLGGVALITAALVATILPLIEGREQHWPVWTVISLVAALPLFLAFGAWQHRLAKNGGAPLVDLSLFKERIFTVGLLTQLVFWMGQASFFLIFALFVQVGHGFDALQAGLLFTPLAAGYLTTSLLARKFGAVLGQHAIAIGGLVMALGLLALQLITTHLGANGSLAWLTPALILDGAGMGMAIAPLASTVLSRVEPHHAGAASGVLSTAQQVGNALGVAIIGIIFYGAVGTSQGTNVYQHAFTSSLLYLVGIAILVASLAQLLPKRQKG